MNESLNRPLSRKQADQHFSNVGMLPTFVSRPTTIKYLSEIFTMVGLPTSQKFYSENSDAQIQINFDITNHSP
jgi:hypothetical protein